MNRKKADRYVREIEGWWQELRGTPVVLSQRDWELICDWYSRGIPLQLVQEALQSAGESRAPRSRPPRTLAYIAPAVEESWSVVCAGRFEELPVSAEGSADVGRGAWESRLRNELPDSPLARLLGELLEKHQQGALPEKVDEELDERLSAAVSLELLDPVQEGVTSELAPFRGRMAQEVFDATFRRALTDRLRARLVLPRLAGASGSS